MCHESRLLNKVVDKLAKYGRKKETQQLFEEWIVPPLFIRKALGIDKDETSFAMNGAAGMPRICTNVCSSNQYASSSSANPNNPTKGQSPQPGAFV